MNEQTKQENQKLLEHFAWPGEQTESRRIFFLRR